MAAESATWNSLTRGPDHCIATQYATQLRSGLHAPAEVKGVGACCATGSSKAALQTPDAAPAVVCAHIIWRHRALQQHLMLQFITAWQGHQGEVRVCHLDCMLHSYLNCRPV